MEPDENQPTNDLKVESLDDLFDDNAESEPKEKIKETAKIASEDSKNTGKLELEEIDEDMPLLPMENENEDEEEQDNEYDLQKELEAKFDELFGPIDDEN